VHPQTEKNDAEIGKKSPKDVVNASVKVNYPPLKHAGS
jgi:hypothetical protein